MKRCGSYFFAVTFLFLSLFVTGTSLGSPPFPASNDDPALAIDTVYVDNFNRANGPLGANWAAHDAIVIDSNELADTSSDANDDDIAVYIAHVNPLGVQFKWSLLTDQAGIDNAGIALRLTGSWPNVNGYYLFKNDGNNSYVLWTIENGAITTRVTTVASTLTYPQAGDEYGVVLRSTTGGHHFDVFYNDQFDVTVTDPYKLQGNGPTLYSGVMLSGSYNNNLDDYTFVQYDDDATPPAAITNLTAIPLSGTSVKLRWTAPGDDGSAGAAGSYDVRFAGYPISEGNWGSAIKVIGEQRPSASGTLDSLTVTNLLPETIYYFGMKTSDGFPKNNFSLLSNVPSSQTLDDTPPNPVTDFTLINVGSRTALLSWTAPGDSDTSGIATEFDVRFSQSPLTEDNWAGAQKGTGEPTPGPYGTYHEYTLNKILPNTQYYIGLKTLDEENNKSALSNVVVATTVLYDLATDHYERTLLGQEYWAADPELQIESGELMNVSDEERWDFSAVFTEIVDVKELDLVWGGNVDVTGTSSGGFLVGMDSESPDANGYLIFRNSSLNKVALWDVIDGVPSAQIVSNTAGTTDPGAGDHVRLIISSDMNGNHFDLWLGGTFDARVSDPNKLHSLSGTKYGGVMLHGNRNNNVENFSIASPMAVLPPAHFSLFQPFDDDTVSTGIPLLDWTDSYDLNPGDSVRYGVWYGTDPDFNENTVFVDGIYESQYQIPAGQLGRILANYVRSLREEQSKGEGPTLAGAGKNRVTELPDNATIYWRVRARDIMELETMCDQLDWSFFVSIPNAPLPFDLIKPTNGVTVASRNPKLIWHEAVDPDPDAESITYEVWYDRLPDFVGATKITGIADTTFITPTLLNFQWYYWKVFAHDEDELTCECVEYFSFYVDSTNTGVEDGTPTTPDLPKMFTLGQNYPNPFNPMTVISYDVPESAHGDVHVNMDIYSVRGVMVRALIDEVKEPGRYTVTWNGTDENGQRVSSGIYFYRMRAGEFTATRKMIILK
jgi:hypothetical protein